MIPASSPPEYRIYLEAAPQDSAYPMIVFRMVDQMDVQTLGGKADLARAYIQIDCYSPSYTTALAMESAVVTAFAGNFAGFKGLVEGRGAEFIEDQKVYAISRDFALWVDV
jgi:hypothetical protein